MKIDIIIGAIKYSVDSIAEAITYLNSPIYSKPAYSRAQILREEWFPPYYQGYYHIDIDNVIHSVRSSTPRFHVAIIDARKLNGCVFSPTRELAEEIVQIRQGKWLPKKGDRIWDSVAQISDCESLRDFNERDFDVPIYYFPSAKQRDAFIEKNRPKESATKLPTMEGRTAYSGIPDGYVVPNSPQKSVCDLTMDFQKLIEELERRSPGLKIDWSMTYKR